MEILALLGKYLGWAWASGINLYLTIASLGIANNIKLINLPHGLDIISHPLIITVAIILFLIEFFADKIPYVDSMWDSLHTVVRPGATAVLAFMGTADLDPAVRFSVTLVCAAIALDSHLIKASSRIAINTSPEPFTNIFASISEDVLVLAMLYAVIRHPVIAGILVVLFVLFSVWFLKIMFRFVRKVFRFTFSKVKERDNRNEQ